MSSTQYIQSVLALQPTMPKPSAAICAAINSIRDLCELSPTSIEWRRTPGVSPSGGSASPVFRGNTLSPSNSQNSFARVGSSKSLGSASPTPPPSEQPFTPNAKMAGSYTSSRYQSKFKDSSKPVEDKILNNILLSKLNKFSSGTYVEIREFLYQILGSGEPDLTHMVRDFMRMVFKKAASEELYCSLYAKLLCELSGRYSVIIDEMYSLQDNYLSIFDEVEEGCEEKSVEKRFRQGYSQFIAELALLEIIKLSYLEQTFVRIFDVLIKLRNTPDNLEIIEEYIDCLLRMSRVFKLGQTPFLISARARLSTIANPVLNDIIDKKGEYCSISSKSRCLLMDVKDNLSSI
jgi:hypothetical protein